MEPVNLNDIRILKIVNAYINGDKPRSFRYLPPSIKAITPPILAGQLHASYRKMDNAERNRVENEARNLLQVLLMKELLYEKMREAYDMSEKGRMYVEMYGTGL